jgi:hypothetical protein
MTFKAKMTKLTCDKIFANIYLACKEHSLHAMQ